MLLTRTLTSFLLACTLHAATYYVSTSGDDSSGGTRSAPFLHITKAVSAVKAGDTIILADGTYHASAENPGSLNNYVSTVIDVSTTGTSGAPITIKAQNRGGAILDGDFTNSSSSANCNGAGRYFLVGTNVNYWVFDGMVFQNLCLAGIATNSNNGQPSAGYITVTHNVFQNIGLYSPTTSTESCYGKEGIFIGGYHATPGSWTIDGNVFHDIGRQGGGACAGNNFRHDHGVYLCVPNTAFTNNIFYNITSGWAIQLCPGDSGNSILNNTFYNTAPQDGFGGMIMFWDDIGTADPNTVIENNVFYISGSNAGTPLTCDSSSGSCNSATGNAFDYNLVYGSTSVGGPSGMAVGSHNLMGTTSADNPLFVSLTTPDFHVQTGSPAIGSGVTLSQVPVDVAGNTRTSPFTMGAYISSVSSVSACDLTGDGVINSSDVSMAVNMVLGKSPCTTNILGANVCNVILVQRVVNASLGEGCLTGP